MDFFHFDFGGYIFFSIFFCRHMNFKSIFGEVDIFYFLFLGGYGFLYFQFGGVWIFRISFWGGIDFFHFLGNILRPPIYT